MPQIITKHIFDKGAFMTGHPYCICKGASNYFGFFVRLEGEYTAVFSSLKRVHTDDNPTLVTDLMEINAEDVALEKVKINPLLISPDKEDKLPEAKIDFIGDEDYELERTGFLQQPTTKVVGLRGLSS